MAAPHERGAGASCASDELLAENERLRESLATLRAGLQAGHAQLAEALQALLQAQSIEERAQSLRTGERHVYMHLLLAHLVGVTPPPPDPSPA